MLTAPWLNIELCVSLLRMNILTYRYYSSYCSFCCIIIAFSVEQAGIMGPPIGRSHDFCRAYSIICTLAPLGPEWCYSGHNKLYAKKKSRNYIIINNRQGQIIQIYFIRKDCFTWNPIAGCKFHLQPALCCLAHEKERFREGGLPFGPSSDNNME